MFVYSTSHKRNFGNAFVAHVGLRTEGGINYMPLCGWRASGPTGVSKTPPAGMRACGKCLRKTSKLGL